jgi:hypothetical protein
VRKERLLPRTRAPDPLPVVAGTMGTALRTRSGARRTKGMSHYQSHRSASAFVPARLRPICQVTDSISMLLLRSRSASHLSEKQWAPGS